MIAEPAQLGPVRTVEDMLQSLLPSKKYKNIKFWKSGGTRDLYLAEWGPGNEKRIIKVDKTELESPRAQRHVERGYDTSNDINALAEIPNPERHHLMRLVDYFDFSKTQGITVAIEQHFESQSLEEKVQEKPLKLKEFETVFAQVIDGVNYLVNTCGMYHRDLKASNVLVNDELEVRITDFANACKKEEVKRKYMPTAGGHWVSDPLVFFNGSENEYKEASEIYSIGTEMFYALTGEHIFEYDADNRTGVSCFTGESLLDEEGIVNRDRHNTALDDALKRLPRKVRKKYGKVIKKCLSLDEEVRYSRVGELKRDFTNEKDKKTWYQHLTSNIVQTSALILTTGFAIGGFVIMQNYDKKLQEAEATAQEESKIKEINSEWDGDNLVIENNFVALENFTYLAGCYKNDRDHDSYPDYPYLIVQPGEKLSSSISLREIAGFSDNVSITLPGKIYIEGFTESEEFRVWTRDWDQGDTYGMGASSLYGYTNIKIPEDISDGNYNLIVEVYAPTEEELSNSRHINSQSLSFDNPGKTIIRKSIPIVVGEVPVILQTQYTNSGYNGNFVSIRRFGKNLDALPKDISFEVTMVDEDYHEEFKPSNSNSLHLRRNLPDVEDSDERILQVIAKDSEGEIFYYTFVPVRSIDQDWGPKVNYRKWELSVPDQSFYEKTAKLGELIRAEESHDEPGEGTVGQVKVSD